MMLEREREKRVEHLQRVAARRLGQLGLARGWSGWLAQHEEQQRVMQLLKHAGGRLMRPKLTASFVEWRDDWREEQLARERAAATAAHEQKLLAQRAELDAQLAQVREELGSARGTAQDGRRELEEALARYGSAEDEWKRQLALQMEDEREKRVQQLQGLAVHRIQNMALARGWSSWLAQHEEKQRVWRLLRHAGGRLLRPKLTASFVEWRDDWQEEQLARERAAAAAAFEQRLLAQLRVAPPVRWAAASSVGAPGTPCSAADEALLQLTPLRAHYPGEVVGVKAVHRGGGDGLVYAEVDVARRGDRDGFARFLVLRARVALERPDICLQGLAATHFHAFHGGASWPPLGAVARADSMMVDGGEASLAEAEPPSSKSMMPLFGGWTARKKEPAPCATSPRVWDPDPLSRGGVSLRSAARAVYAVLRGATQSSAAGRCGRR